MVQLEFDKQVVLFAFLSLLIHLNFMQVCLHVKMLVPTSAAWMIHLMERKLLWLSWNLFYLKHTSHSDGLELHRKFKTIAFLPCLFVYIWFFFVRI